MKFTAKLNGHWDVIRLLKRYPEKVGRTMTSIVKQEGRALAVELARNTRPWGFSDSARKRGEKAVAGDIRKVYATPADAYEHLRDNDPASADRFWAQIQNRRFARARGILQSSTSSWNALTVGRLDPDLHKGRRLGDGTVRDGDPSQVVTSNKALATYVARIQRRVGFAKGTWIKAGKAVGGRIRGAVQWVTRHRQSPGTARVRTGAKARVTLINNLDYVDDVTTPKGIQLALKVSQGRLRKALVTSLRKMNRKANRQWRRKAS